MELKPMLWRLGVLNLVINVVLGLPGTYYSFRQVSLSAPAPFIIPGLSLKPSLFGDFWITAFLMGLILSWIMVAAARKMLATGKVFIQPESRLATGAAWKTKGFRVGLIVAGVSCAALAVLAWPLAVFFSEVTFSSLSLILTIKALYAGILAWILTWITFRMAALNHEALTRGAAIGIE